MITIDSKYVNKLAPLVVKFKKGEYVTDGEVKLLVTYYKQLVTLLEAQGERYYFAWRDSKNELERATTMINARRRTKAPSYGLR